MKLNGKIYKKRHLKKRLKKNLEYYSKWEDAVDEAFEKNIDFIITIFNFTMR